MSLKSVMTAAATPLVALSTAAAEPPPPPQLSFNPAQAKGSVSTSIIQGCAHLPDKDCVGKGASISYTTPGGFTLEIVKTDDMMDRTNFSFDRTIAGKAHLHADTHENLAIQGTTLKLRKNFQLGESVQLQGGLYIGKLSGQARMSALATASMDSFQVNVPATAYTGPTHIGGQTISIPVNSPARTINVPQIAYNGTTYINAQTITVPAYSNTVNINVPEVAYNGPTHIDAQTITVPARSHTFVDKHSFDEASSPYGGLTAGTGWGIQLGKIGKTNAALRLSADGRAGVDVITGSIGAEFLLMSSPDRKAASRPGLDQLHTSGEYAIGIGFRTTKVFRDRLYEVEERFAETHMRDVYNAKVDQINARMADRVAGAAPGLAAPQIPRKTTADMLRFLQLDDPTAHMHNEVTLSGFYRLTPQVSLAAQIGVPVGFYAARSQTRAQFSLNYEF